MDVTARGASAAIRGENGALKGDRKREKGLLRDALDVVKVKGPDGKTRFSIKPLESELSFDKGFYVVIRAIQALTTHNKDFVLVGLAGPSGSGKTAFSDKIKTFIPGCVTLSMDNYNDGSKVIDGNFDDPRITDYDTLLANIADLREGRPTQVPIYDYKESRRVGYRAVEVPESRVIILEGIYALNARLRPRLDLRVSITGGVHFDLVKRVLRDIDRSGQAPEDIIQQVSDTVYPMYKAFIEPDLKAAHLRIYNTFNPFSGFMSPTYILKSARPLDRAAVAALLEPATAGASRSSDCETYDIYLVPPAEDPETCQSWLRMRYRDGRYNLMFEEWVVDGVFIISPRVTFEVPVRILGGLMALGYEIGTIMQRRTESFWDDKVTVKFDTIEGMDKVFVQVQGKDRATVAAAGAALGLDGTYIPHSYIELVQLENLTQSFQTVTEDLKRRFAVNGEPLIDESVVGSYASRGSSPSRTLSGSWRRTTGFSIPARPALSSSAPIAVRGMASASAGRGSGLLSQRMASPEVNGAIFIAGASSTYDPADRGNCGTPEQPYARQSSRPASPVTAALEAQVARLLLGQTNLGNQMEELALQVSLAQVGGGGGGSGGGSGSGGSNRSTPAVETSMRTLAMGPDAPRAWGQGLVAATPPGAAWAAAGAVVGAAATYLLLRGGSR